jgi:hypothetical protein
MPATLSIDDTTGALSLVWVDDKGDTDAAAPAGALVAFTVDNPAVATVDPATGIIAPLAEGVANGSATITGADGSPLLEPDGVTPYTVTPIPFTVVAGAAVGVQFEIKS